MLFTFGRILFIYYEICRVLLLLFLFNKVGTNCGLIGKNAAVEVDGSAYWMSENGFFRYTGRLESLPCLVEDYVYDDINTFLKIIFMQD